MTEKEAIKILRNIQNAKKVEYEDAACAAAWFSIFKYVYPEPEDYVIEEAIKALEEIQQYRVIGTVEECRESVEKQKPKKPVKRSFIIPYEGIDVCPNCKEPINKKEHHCKCGQAIDGGGEE